VNIEWHTIQYDTVLGPIKETFLILIAQLYLHSTGLRRSVRLAINSVYVRIGACRCEPGGHNARLTRRL